MSEVVKGAILGGRALARGVVQRFDDNDLRVVTEQGGVIRCDVLNGATACVFRPGDAVIVLLPKDSAERGVVLGTVSRYLPGTEQAEPAGPRLISGETVIVEAQNRLELRVGESSIAIADDGTITIRGKNVLSRAMALNKIRGAAVRIN